MDHVLAAMMLGVVAIGQMLAAGQTSGRIASPKSALMSESTARDLPSLPAAPEGKSTILGGEIRSVDFVRDQFMLKVFGQRPVKILFDARTQVFLDGKKIPLHDLHSYDHASVQTVLDKTSVFALSIHMLSRSPEGEYQGQVLNFNPETRELTIGAALSQQPIKLLVPIDAHVAREGQGASPSELPGPSDLVKGALISVKFQSDKRGRGVASQIVILAAPGSTFEFSGKLSSLDMHSGFFVLVDPRDEKSYQIFFDSVRLPASQRLHEGDSVSVTARFDGDRYVASMIDIK
jgi:hypothetical protein